MQEYYDKVAKQFAGSGRTAPPLNDQIKGQIRMSLEGERNAERQLKYADELFGKYQVAMVLPDPIRFEIAKGNLPSKGSESAKVSVIEFSDYQCPFCKRGAGHMKEVAKKFGSKIDYRFRDFPLEQIHPRARAASNAARCANEQGKFWEYHNELFENQDKLEDDHLKELAGKLKLDAEKFSACLDAKKYDSEVDADLNDGRVAGVTGTPAYFINGIFVSGAVPPEKLSEIIEKELK